MLVASSGPIVVWRWRDHYTTTMAMTVVFCFSYNTNVRVLAAPSSLQDSPCLCCGGAFVPAAIACNYLLLMLLFQAC
jgi:hypothetical protein